MRNLFRFCPLLLAAALMLGAGPAFAGKRVALVLANSAYQHAPSLTNPVNDGAVMAKTLKDAGFDVVDSRHDLTALDTRRVLRDFADSTRDADIAVVYYAGHGIEVEGSNYLIPVDAKLERDTDVYDEALSLDRVLVAVEPAKQLRLVILDACRDNPFGRTMKRTLATRGIGRGLAQVEPTTTNTLIAYSAKAGFTAQDGDGANSPFTIALSKHLTTPGLDVRRAFGFVRDDVLKSTGNKQEPFVYGSLGGEDVPLVPVKATPAPVIAAAPAPAVNPQADMRRDYELALQVGNRPAWEAFLAQHPDGFYANLAKLQIDKIQAEQAHAAAIEKAKQAEAERDRLAALGAQKDAQAKAAADAKAAEQAQLAAQKAKEQAQQQAAAAEQQRVSLAATAPSAAPASTATPTGTNVASLTPAAQPADLSRSVQTELGRVGCFSGQADGNWNTSSQRSLSQFNRYAGTRLDVKVASTDALDAVKSRQSRVCPLVCDHGFKADGDKCTKIVCGDGYVLNDDNECEKQRAARPAKPATAKRDDSDDRPARQRRQSGGTAGGAGAAAGIAAAAGAGRAPSGGQMFCNSVGCRPVNRGCHLEYRGGGGPGNDANAEVCN
jgi:uncharacterized caspase-like protein